jgi:hypothetical protein
MHKGRFNSALLPVLDASWAIFQKMFLSANYYSSCSEGCRHGVLDADSTAQINMSRGGTTITGGGVQIGSTNRLGDRIAGHADQFIFCP